MWAWHPKFLFHYGTSLSEILDPLCFWSPHFGEYSIQTVHRFEIKLQTWVHEKTVHNVPEVFFLVKVTIASYNFELLVLQI